MKGAQPVLVISENTTAYTDENKYLIQPPAIAAFTVKVALRTKQSNMKNISIKLNFFKMKN